MAWYRQSGRVLVDGVWAVERPRIAVHLANDLTPSVVDDENPNLAEIRYVDERVGPVDRDVVWL